MHTKGPWETTGKRKLFIEPINMRIHYNEMHDLCKTCNVRKTTDISEGSQIFGKYARDLKEAQANARLIAAAPDLLEALKAVHRFSSIIPVRLQNDLWSIINPVIAKAK